MNKEDIKYCVGFNIIPGIGRVKFNQLETYFGSLEDAWRAGPAELMRAGLDRKSARTINEWRPRISPEAEMKKLEHCGIEVLTWHDSNYPARLKEIYDYPPVLYIRGSIIDEDEWCLAVVGTRQPTAYGRQVTEEIVNELSRSRITIVSGLARGIDSVAHKSALEAGGRSIAVMGGGLDSIYPAENTNLARSIIKKGALLSEYHPGTKPRPENFPRRNRIMSGISLGVLVIEAGKASGALITAHLALEQNREVFAIPGSILSPSSIGTNQLIKEGAKLVRDFGDILEELNLTAIAKQLEMKEIIPSSDTEALLLKKLGAEPVHIDEICRASDLPMATVSSTMAMMELKGMVKQVGMMNYSLCRKAREKYIVEID
ncbi:MAG: DNA-processing protein DprA [Chloroflexota bacterium]